MHIVRPGVALATLIGISAAGLAAAIPATAADSPAPQDALVINEVSSTGDAPDSIEILNIADSPVDLDGLVVMDSKDEDAAVLTGLDPLPAGGYAVLESGREFEFGLGKGDSVRLFAPGTALTEQGGLVDPSTQPFDATTWPADTHAEPSWGRCPDASGEFAMTASATFGSANDCATQAGDTVETSIRINEVQSSNPDDSFQGGEDWIEIVNTAAVELDLGGVVVSDSDADHWYIIPEQTLLGAGAHLVLGGYDDEANPDGTIDFGLGKGDSVRLFAAGTAIVDGEIAPEAVPFDATAWPDGQHTIPSWGRCPDGVGDFRMTGTATPSAANDCSGDYEPPVEEPAELSGDLAINEVESNGDDTDWVEVANLTAAPIDISGWAIKDDNDGRTDVVPAGSVVPAGGLLVIDQESATYPEGFTFGLGNGDTFRLYDLDGTLQAKYSWPTHALVSWARCPDGTGEWRDATASTKGASNECSTPLRINEIESSDASDGPDWVEIMNIGATAVDASGLIVKDDDDAHVYEIPAGTTVAPGGLLLIDTLGFGLGGGDQVRLFDADGETVIDAHGWDAHAATTYGRCPDGSGAFETTVSATPGELNDCAGLVRASAWPGGAEVTVLDDEAWFAGDMSGIDYDAATGDLWAVQNGDGLLYRLTADAAGTWSIAAGWEAGRTLRYPDGTGTVDAEGVTVRDGEPGVVYVSSERDNDGSGSRPSVLRYEVAGSGELIATDEWNLAQLAPLSALPANGGLEGITWIPGIDAFGVGVEGTASVYIVTLQAGGGATLVETLSTESVSFPLVADVQWDAEREVLWVVCDEACDGRIATFAQVDGSWELTDLFERPTGMPNVANEGFAIADSSLCVDGAVQTFYVDDADTDGFSLRSGTLPCVETDPGEGPGEGPGDGGDTPAPGPGGEPGQQPEVTLCDLAAPASAAAGQTITVTVDPDCAPATVTGIVALVPVTVNPMVSVAPIVV